MGSFPKRCIFTLSQCGGLTGSRELWFRIKHSQPPLVKLRSEKVMVQTAHSASRISATMGFLSVTIICKYLFQMKTDAHSVLMLDFSSGLLKFLLIIFNKVMDSSV